MHRIALNEIYVPYGLPDRTWVWRAALDVGEYNLGQYTEPLEKDVDVPDNAAFLDEATFNDVGTRSNDPASFPLPNATAIYERHGGSLWDRTDPTTFERDARLGRELVVTAAVVNGNYTYNVEYVFRMDGGIDVRAGATGTTLNRGVSDVFTGDAFSTLVARNIAAPAHQHFFNFRIDFDVDGTNNRVIEENTHGAPSDLDNRFVTDETVLTTEGFRDSNPATTRRLGGGEHQPDQRARDRDGVRARTRRDQPAVLRAHLRAAHARAVRPARVLGDPVSGRRALRSR
jgi:primary-amine oxidase